MIAAVAYAEPPAIVRRADTTHLQAQGECGNWLDDYLAKISERLEQSREWQGVRIASISVHSEESDDPIEGLELRLMPPNKTYTAQAHFYYAGRGEPLPYDFGDYFDDDEDEE